MQRTLARPQTAGITVPRDFTFLLNEDRPSKEWREAAIRDLIIKNKGEVLNWRDFNRVVGLTEKSSGGSQLVAALIKRGRVTRLRAEKARGEKGIRYTYVWHDAPLEVKPQPTQFKEDPANSGVMIFRKNVPTSAPNMGKFDRVALREAFIDWLDEVENDDHILIAGASKFRRFLESR